MECGQESKSPAVFLPASGRIAHAFIAWTFGLRKSMGLSNGSLWIGLPEEVHRTSGPHLGFWILETLFLAPGFISSSTSNRPLVQSTKIVRWSALVKSLHFRFRPETRFKPKRTYSYLLIPC